jgi:hypothetical protein
MRNPTPITTVLLVAALCMAVLDEGQATAVLLILAGALEAMVFMLAGNDGLG